MQDIEETGVTSRPTTSAPAVDPPVAAAVESPVAPAVEAPVAPAVEASVAQAVEASVAHARAVLAIICASYFMVILDNSIMFTALPSIRTSMGLSDTGLAWVQDAYVLVFGGLMLLGARSGDLLGRRRMFVISLVLFAVASLLVGVAPSGWLLIAARALQGVGAAILAPTSLALITASFPDGAKRSRAVAAYAAVAGIGASAGLLVGGAVTQWISWRAGFFLDVPVAAVMIFASLRYLSETPRTTGRFDAIGALTATLGMGALVYGIIGTAEVGWSSPRTLISIAIGLVLLVALVFNEAKAEQPIMPLRLFVSRQRSGAYAVRLLYLGAMIGFFYFTTQFFQDVLGWSPLQAGLGFLPMTAVNFAVATRVPALSRRFGDPSLLTAGVATTLLGMALLSRATPDGTYAISVALPMVLVGAGQGMAFAPLTTFGIYGVERADAGAASGVLNTAHQLGTALGLAVLVSLASGVDGTGVEAQAKRFHSALTGSTGMLALGLLIVLVLVTIGRRERRREAHGASLHAGPSAVGTLEQSTVGQSVMRLPAASALESTSTCSSESARRVTRPALAVPVQRDSPHLHADLVGADSPGVVGAEGDDVVESGLVELGGGGWCIGPGVAVPVLGQRRVAGARAVPGDPGVIRAGR